jgi:predicted dehydrogenase
VADLRLPSPRTPDPREAPPLRWGILAPGWIAQTFAEGVRAHTRQEIRAVGSRSLERAQAFATEVGAGAAYGSYEELVADPDVDVVYVASPHSEHRDHALLAIEAGKAVLVEKAFARSAAQAREVFDAAERQGVFAMEAMWTRFLPHTDVVRQCLEQGLLGDVHTVMADHGQLLYPDGPQRLSDPALAGGALLDLGVYPVSFAHFALGAFESVTATGVLTDLGVDSQESITVRTATHALGLLGTTMLTKTPTVATVCGTRARLDIGGDFYTTGVPVRLFTPDGELHDEYAFPVQGHRLDFEAAEVARCVSAGLSESPLLPWSETIAVMETMDEVRRQVGVRYPGE